MGLNESDIKDTVTIDKVRHRVDKKDVTESPKTKTSVRTLAVPKFIQDDVHHLIELHKTRPEQGSYLIQNAFGEPVNPSWATRHINNLTRTFDLPPITMHGLRHTYASMLINKGIPIAEVSMQLGHSSIDITLRTYAHLFTEASTASRRISDLFDDEWHQNDTKK